MSFASLSALAMFAEPISVAFPILKNHLPFIARESAHSSPTVNLSYISSPSSSASSVLQTAIMKKRLW